MLAQQGKSQLYEELERDIWVKRRLVSEDQHMN